MEAALGEGAGSPTPPWTFPYLGQGTVAGAWTDGEVVAVVSSTGGLAVDQGMRAAVAAVVLLAVAAAGAVVGRVAVEVRAAVGVGMAVGPAALGRCERA